MGKYAWIVGLGIAAHGAWAAPPPPREAFERTHAVLSHFNVEDEGTPRLDELDRRQTRAGLTRMLPYLDPTGQLKRLGALTDSELTFFRDRDARTETDFTVRLRPATESAPADARAERWRARSLAGMRIALDPGHMGGDRWDRMTGKYYQLGSKLLSEGVLALQTALVLERELKALGADVLITRRSLAPVTPIPFDALDVTAFGRQALRESAHLDWFLNLLSTGPAGPALYRAFMNAPAFKALFSERAREDYFILGADLDARAEMIERFRPDLTLVIHYDTREQPGFSGTKTFVAGSFMATELASREDRALFARHALDPWAWRESVRLSQTVVTALTRELGLPIDRAGSNETREVAPGVRARNLVLTRKLTGHPVSYVECLHYNSPAEFAALTRPEFPLVIDGENHPYSARLAQVAAALRQSVVAFARGTGN